MKLEMVYLQRYMCLITHWFKFQNFKLSSNFVRLLSYRKLSRQNDSHPDETTWKFIYFAFRDQIFWRFLVEMQIFQLHSILYRAHLCIQMYVYFFHRKPVETIFYFVIFAVKDIEVRFSKFLILFLLFMLNIRFIFK